MGRLSEQEFGALVRDVAASVYGQSVKALSVGGFTVEAAFPTAPEGVWAAYYVFNEETGHYRYRCACRSAGSPWTFGDEVGRRIREAVAD